MKTIKYTLAALVLMGLTLTSCDKTPLGGSAIRFSATTKTETKASYSGERSGGKERIEWTKGDLIRICCEQSMTPDCHYADYAVGEDISNKDATSSTKVTPTAAPICWGETSAAHVFYGVYPSPAVKSGDGMTVKGVLSGTIPAVQVPASMTSKSGAYTAAADLKNEYMVAKASTAKNSEVSLHFTPVITAIEFTIENGFASGNDLEIASVCIESKTVDLAGSFTADLSKWSGTYPTCTTTAANGKSVTIDFTGLEDGKVTIQKGETLKFTFFCLSEKDVTDLTFKIKKANDDGKVITTELRYNEDPTNGNKFVSFPCHKKSFVKGLLVPEGIQWTISYDPTLKSWEDKDGGNIASEDQDVFLSSWTDGPAEDISLDVLKPLCFDAPTNHTFSMSVVLGETPTTHATWQKVEISRDMIEWTSYTSALPTGISFGGTAGPLYVRGSNPQGFWDGKTNDIIDMSRVTELGQDLDIMHQYGPRFSISGAGTDVKVSGNLMSLIDMDEKTTKIPVDCCFSFLFANCDPLVDASGLVFPDNTAESCYLGMFYSCQHLSSYPELPAMKLSSACYAGMFIGNISMTAAPELPAKALESFCYTGMFMMCVSLQAAPQLPAREIPIFAYSRMFSGCTGMSSAPDLPAKKLDNYAYSSMFSGCTKIMSAPVLPAFELASYCYNEMFKGCTKLNYIKMMALDSAPEGCLNEWVSGVSATGSFIKNAAATWNVSGISGIPSGWSVSTSTN